MPEQIPIKNIAAITIAVTFTAFLLIVIPPIKIINHKGGKRQKNSLKTAPTN